MRPFRCTICLESFDSELQLQLHLLSQAHQDRARPGLQKALMTLQSLNSSIPMDVDSVQSTNCPDSEQNPDVGFINIPEVLLERLASQSSDVRSSSVPGIPPAISAQLLLQQLENQRSMSNLSPSPPGLNTDNGRKRSSNSSAGSRRISDEQATVLKQQLDVSDFPNEDHLRQVANDSGIPMKLVKHWYRNMRQTNCTDNLSPQPLDGDEGTSDVHMARSEDGSVISKETNDRFDDQFSDDDCGLKIVEPEDDGRECKTENMSDGQNNRFLDSASNDGNDQSNRRMRTLISPDQAEVLYREYLEVIRHSEVGA